MCKSKRLKDLKIRHIVLLDDYGYDYKDFFIRKKRCRKLHILSCTYC